MASSRRQKLGSRLHKISGTSPMAGGGPSSPPADYLSDGEKRPYEYDPLFLDQSVIRLLVLQPLNIKNPRHLVGGLVRHSLASDSLPKYETISYHWMPSNEKACIFLDGCKLNVPYSAYSALRRMRLLDKPRVLWIDAICINQSDMAERSRQVSIMHQIYAGGARNLVWLGEDHDNEMKRLIWNLETVVEHMRIETDDYVKLKDALYHTDHRVTKLPGIPGIDQEVIIRFFSRPWFRRLWVIQEVSVSKTSICVCGEYEIPLPKILDAVEWLCHQDRSMYTLPGLNTASMLALFSPCLLSELTTYKVDFFYRLVSKVQGFEASDARDYIYGLLGLWAHLSRNEGIAITPDYTLNIETVYRMSTLAMIWEIWSIALLQAVTHRSEKTLADNWSSWTWRANEKHSPLSDAIDLPQWTSAGMPMRRLIHRVDRITLLPYLNVAPDSAILPVHGFLVDAIDCTSEVQELAQSEGKEARLIFEDIPAALLLRTIMTCSRLWGVWRESHWDYYMQHLETASKNIVGRVVIANTNHVFGRADEYDSTRITPLFEKLRDKDGPPISAPLREWCSFLGEELTLTGMMCFNACNKRKFFITRDGRMGIGPKIMREDDVLVILHWLRWPAVLRRSGTAHWMFLGTCYVDGIMDGELLRRCKCTGPHKGDRECAYERETEEAYLEHLQRKFDTVFELV